MSSPIAGIDRQMLDRIGNEVARATTIVRYAPGSAFPAHTHPGGEEYLVLEGVFQDEHGDYPVGTYVRNPPTSMHTPSASNGATIFVKLWQFDSIDRVSVSIDTKSQTPAPVKGRDCISEIPLFKDNLERVRIEIWEPCQNIEIIDHQGLEILVIEGSFEESGEVFTAQSWLRLPVRQPFTAKAGVSGSRLWIKSDHLSKMPSAPGV